MKTNQTSLSRPGRESLARRPRRYILYVTLALLCAAQAKAEIEVQHSTLEKGVVSQDADIGFALNRLPTAQEGLIKLVIGTADITGLLLANTDGTIRIAPNLYLLPEGDTEAAMYLVTVQGQWQEIGRWNFRVASTLRFTEAEFSPNLTVSNSGQIDEGHSDQATPPERRTYQDFTMAGGMRAQHASNDFEFSSAFNIFGASRQEERLRFFEKENAANSIELSDFLLELNKGGYSARAGHITIGNNPLLLSSFGSRGISLSRRFGKRFDVSVSSMNATSIVGFNNFSGLGNGNHRIDTASIGWELIPERRGGLRAEVTYSDAQKESDLNFNVGEVADSETSEGWGVRLLGSNQSGRLQADLSLASSRFSNPNDPFLAQGDNIVRTRPTRDMARHLQISYTPVRDLEIAEGINTSFTLTYVHDRADPLYRTIGAFVAPDNLSDRYALSGQIGYLQVSAGHQRTKDNLDNVATILKTKTEGTNASFSGPLGRMLGYSGRLTSVLPQVSYNYNRIHQFALNNPGSELSGFNGGNHLPNQLNKRHDIGLNWAGSRWSAGLRSAKASQDNRQTGREISDFELIDHSINFSIRPTDTLNVGITASMGRNEDMEAALTRKTRSQGLNVEWQLTNSLLLGGHFDTSKGNDSIGNFSNVNETGSAQISWNFELPTWGRKSPGQLFFRYSRQENDSKDNMFDFESHATTWFLNTGLSITLF